MNQAGEMGGLLVTLPIALIAFFWIALKSQPSAMEKPPTKLTYIGVWIVIAFIANSAANIFILAFSYSFPQIFYNRNPEIIALVAFYGISLVITFYITFFCYKNFPRLNFHKVKPYFWIFGTIGVISLVGQIIKSHKNQFTYSGDLVTVYIIVAVIGFISIRMLTKSLDNLQNAKSQKVPSIKRETIAPTPAASKQESVPITKPKQQYEKNEKTANILPENKPSKPIVGVSELRNYPKAATVLEYDENAAALWTSLQGIQQGFRHQFLEELENNPRQDVKNLYDKAVKADYLDKNPYEDIGANTALHEASAISSAAKEEFERVYDLLGDKIDPAEILEKIKQKFGLQQTPASTFIHVKEWEKLLDKAIYTADIASINNVFKKLGYAIEEYNEGGSGEIFRPVTKYISKPVKLPYKSPHDLVRLAKFERKIIQKHFQEADQGLALGDIQEVAVTPVPSQTDNKRIRPEIKNLENKKNLEISETLETPAISQTEQTEGNSDKVTEQITEQNEIRVLDSEEEIMDALNAEQPLPPDVMATAGYGDLSFNCGCGKTHGVNDPDIEKIASYQPVKILFKCETHYTKVRITGVLKQTCVSEWTMENKKMAAITKNLGL